MQVIGHSRSASPTSQPRPRRASKRRIIDSFPSSRWTALVAPQRRNAVSAANRRTQSDPAFLKYRERVVTANRLHGCQSRERRDRDCQLHCLMLFHESVAAQIVPEISLLTARKNRFNAYWQHREIGK